MLSIVMIEQQFFGDDRLFTVEYQQDGDDLVIETVKVGKNVYWNELGAPAPHYVEVDILPILHAWQVQDFADQVKEELKRKAAHSNELLAA